MTPEEADKLFEQVQRMDFEQLRLLMRWIYLEFGKRCADWRPK